MSRLAFVVPTIACIFAGCLSIQASAIADFVASFYSAIRASVVLRSGNFGLQFYFFPKAKPVMKHFTKQRFTSAFAIDVRMIK